jgi:4-hydroxybenzoyl-CoA reductase subunit beta
MAGLPAFRLERPATAAEAIDLRMANPGSRFLAGGTDLLPNLRRGLATPELLIDLGGVAELRSVDERPGLLRIGAGVTLAAIAADDRVRRCLPALAQAALGVAGPSHRTAATLGGNLCLDTRCKFYNQSGPWREGNQFCMKLEGDTCRVAPKSSRCYAVFSGDVAPALMVLDAIVEILGTSAQRRLPLRGFYRDDGLDSLDLRAGELLVAVEVPLLEGWISGYEKVRVRGAIDFPLAGVAVALRRDGEVLEDVRIACTGVSSRPERVDGLESVRGARLDEPTLARIETLVQRCAKPMETTVVSARYRRRVLPVLARRLFQRLWTAGG